MVENVFIPLPYSVFSSLTWRGETFTKEYLNKIKMNEIFFDNFANQCGLLYTKNDKNDTLLLNIYSHYYSKTIFTKINNFSFTPYYIFQIMDLIEKIIKRIIRIVL